MSLVLNNWAQIFNQATESHSGRSGSELFAIKYVIMYQQLGSSNLIGWKLEMGMAS